MLTGYGAGVAAVGVIQQRALHGRRGSFYALAVVRADDRFRGDVGVSRAIALVTFR
jgi:hypothetical protein